VVECVAGEARGSAEGSLAAVLDGRMVLLHPAGDRDDRGRILQWLGHIVERARRIAPSSRPQAIAAEGSVGLGELSARVSELEGLWQVGPRAEEKKKPVMSARDFALERLLQRCADTREARDFVEHQLERLIAWDHEHRTNLLTVLEAALDYPRHDLAAGRCFMHRTPSASVQAGDGDPRPQSRGPGRAARRARRAQAAQGARATRRPWRHRAAGRAGDEPAEAAPS
jgi:hypothetical protein